MRGIRGDGGGSYSGSGVSGGVGGRGYSGGGPDQIYFAYTTPSIQHPLTYTEPSIHYQCQPLIYIR